jgi:hypothetical protein
MIGALVATGLLAPAAARADHHDMAPGDGRAAAADPFTAGVSLIAATFSPSVGDSMYFGGNYQGVIPAAAYANGRFLASASWAYYRLERNGNANTGVGDIVVHGRAALLDGDSAHAGVMMSLSMPTGVEAQGLGMGHPMVMPAAWAAWRLDRVGVSGSVGYSWALGAGAHVHGMQPLVEPMNMREITWSASADLALPAGVRAGPRISGGVPIAGMGGADRVIGAMRVGWGMHRVDTSAEVQVGLFGDPFNIRGVVSTALRF